MVVTNTTKFIVSIDRNESLPYYTPLKVWVEMNEDNPSDFRFCARGDESFGAVQKDVRIVSLLIYNLHYLHQFS